jgi:hypothetical protein
VTPPTANVSVNTSDRHRAADGMETIRFILLFVVVVQVCGYPLRYLIHLMCVGLFFVFLFLFLFICVLI